MTRRNKERAWLACFIIVSLTGLMTQAEASGDRVTQSNDMNNQTTGDVATNIAGDSSKALGIGFSSPSFGVAISQCLATEAVNLAFGAWGKQSVTLNYHCMGLAYMQFGMIEAGVYMLCNPEEGPLSQMPNCEDAVRQFNTAAPPPPVDTSHADDEEYHQEQYEEQMMLVADLQASIDNLENAPEPVQITTREIVEVQQPFLISKEMAAELKVAE